MNAFGNLQRQALLSTLDACQTLECTLGMGDVKPNVKARVPALCKQAELVVWSCHKSGLNSNTFGFQHM